MNRLLIRIFWIKKSLWNILNVKPTCQVKSKTSFEIVCMVRQMNYEQCSNAAPGRPIYDYVQCIWKITKEKCWRAYSLNRLRIDSTITTIKTKINRIVTSPFTLRRTTEDYPIQPYKEKGVESLFAAPNFTKRKHFKNNIKVVWFRPIKCEPGCFQIIRLHCARPTHREQMIQQQSRHKC